MANRLDGKVAVVTGGASGIGAATARRFVAEGASVVIADVQQELGGQLAAELGPHAWFAYTDVSREADVGGAIALAIDMFGALDVMFNNAGIIGVTGRIAETPVDAWDMTTAVLLRGVFLGMKHAAAVMVPAGRGCIVSTASTAGVNGGLGTHCYTACKHAVVGLTKSVASELAPKGIRVNCVSPGYVVTPLAALGVTGLATATSEAAQRIVARSPLGIAGTPDDIAAAVLYLASDDARYVTGHNLIIDAGETSGGDASRVHDHATATLRESGRRE